MTEKREASSQNNRQRSRIWTAVNRFTARIYTLLATGLLGKIFTAYDSEEIAAKSILGTPFRKRSVSGVRHWISRSFENSRILKRFHKFHYKLLECSLSVYGIFFALYGCYALTMYFVFHAGDSWNYGYIVSGLMFLLISFPMLFSGMSLAQGLKRSRVMHWLLIGICGMSEEALEIPPKSGSLRYVCAVSVAVLCGLFTYFFHPLLFPAVAILLVLVVLIFCQPEIGVVILLFVCPFLSFFSHPTYLLIGIIGVTLFAYLCKLVCGRRVFHFGLLDCMILIFAMMTLFGGIVTNGGIGSFQSATGYLLMICGYFIICNLARTKLWQRRCSIALFSSGVLVALIGVWEHFFADLTPQWLDQTMFAGISGRVTSAFSNPNMLAVYLVMILPIALGFVITQKRLFKGFLVFFGFILIAVCTVFTWSRGAWIGAIVALLGMLLIYSNKTLSVLLIGALPIGAAGAYLFSDRIGNSLLINMGTRFASIGNLSDSSTLYRVYTWRGVGAMLQDKLFCGIGVGESAFTEVYPIYALSGIESVMHSHNLYLQILVEIGIVGLIVFLLTMFLFLQKCFGFLSESKDTRTNVMVIAGLCAIMGAMVMGMVDYIWYNYTVCFVFWAIIGLTCSYIRVGKEEKERSFLPTDNSPIEAEITFNFDRTE